MHISPSSQYGVNIQNYNKKPAFKALYFKNDKIKNKVQAISDFPKALENEKFQEAASKFNIVVIDTFKDELDRKKFVFRACSDIVEIKKKPSRLMRFLGSRDVEYEILPAGMKCPKLYFDNIDDKFHTYTDGHWAYPNHAQLDYLACPLKNFKDIFDKLVFKNNAVKESFMNNPHMVNFLAEDSIREALPHYNIYIKDTSDSIAFQLCTDLTKRGNNILPAGYYTPVRLRGRYSFDVDPKQELDLLVSLSEKQNNQG